MADSLPRSRSRSPYSRRAERSYREEERPRSRSPRRRPNRSPSPPRRDPHRSRSPRRRHEDRPRKSGGGFRWKEKPRYDEDDRQDERRLERGYRDQERPRPRSPVRDSGRKDSDRRDRGRRDDIQDKFGGDKPEKKEKEKEKKAAAPVAAPTGEPMIIVNVNDRLGTKAAIPCLASDPIKLFKAQVAARIGREPHEIMLKRQGERPFKDQLTLEDYGVSNGVQLDLEVDTGD
ncbi:hypothetical protein MMC28_007607 [Mycoblastus sanguinarius]|nr:hypothetical protein [Mycoblastus sanguinarius]